MKSNSVTKYRLLLIDDEEACLTALEMSLFNTEYEVIKTSSGRDGIQYIIDHPNTIDIILLDLMMPDLSGIEVIQELNKIGCKVPVIIQTASYNYSDISKALKFGAKNFLSKPFDKKLLLSVLSKTFNNEDILV
ncbi:MAG: response regulator [Alphaproteobacteria bacterium]